jgi:hypothetical protein
MLGHGSRRAVGGAPHHEDLQFCCENRPHPEEPAKAGVSKDRPQKDCATTLAMRLHSTRNDRDRLTFGDDIIELDEKRLDRTRRRRGHRYLHLHGFDHHNFIAIRNGSSNLHGSCADASRDLRDDLNFWHAIAFLLSSQNA